MLRGYSFRPRVWALTLALGACVAFVLLGWLAYAERWIPGRQANYGELLAPRPLAGPLAPLRGKWVLVTFDAAACGAACERKLYVVRQVRRAQGKEAERVERLPHALVAGSAPSGPVRQNLDIAAFAAETGLQLEPLVIEQHSDSGDGLARDWPRADLGIERNESYALQWYSFAALAIVLAVVLSLRRDAPR